MPERKQKTKSGNKLKENKDKRNQVDLRKISVQIATCNPYLFFSVYILVSI